MVAWTPNALLTVACAFQSSGCGVFYGCSNLTLTVPCSVQCVHSCALMTQLRSHLLFGVRHEVGAKWQRGEDGTWG